MTADWWIPDSNLVPNQLHIQRCPATRELLGNADGLRSCHAAKRGKWIQSNFVEMVGVGVVGVEWGGAGGVALSGVEGVWSGVKEEWRGWSDV